MATRQLIDTMANFVASAVADVREKLVHEAWFGRTESVQSSMSTPSADPLSRFLESDHSNRSGPYDQYLAPVTPSPDGPSPAPIERHASHTMDQAQPTSRGTQWDHYCAFVSAAPHLEPTRDLDHERDSI